MNNLTVHIVEDEIIIALDLEDILEDMGHKVDVSYTIKEAMTKAAERPSDLFLIDIHMHGADRGLELGKELQQQKIPHIYLSAYSDEETKDMAASTSSMGYLNKPFSEKELKELVKNASLELSKSKP